MLVIVAVVMVVLLLPRILLLVPRGKRGPLAAPLDQSACRFVTHSDSSNFDESLWVFCTNPKRTPVGLAQGCPTTCVPRKRLT